MLMTNKKELFPLIEIKQTKFSAKKCAYHKQGVSLYRANCLEFMD